MIAGSSWAATPASASTVAALASALASAAELLDTTTINYICSWFLESVAAESRGSHC